MTKQVCYFALKSICCAHHLTLIYAIKIIIIIAKHIQIFYLFIYIRLLILSDILIAQAKILLKPFANDYHPHYPLRDFKARP